MRKILLTSIFAIFCVMIYIKNSQNLTDSQNLTGSQNLSRSQNRSRSPDPYDPVIPDRDFDKSHYPSEPEIPILRDDKTKRMILKNYPTGKFKNENSVMFCNMVVDQVDNIMKRNDKIISINIKGFADGLKNPGLYFSGEISHSECFKYFDPSKKVYDKELAILRACEIEGQLKSLLTSKPYFMFVSYTNTFHDIKDGGFSGDEYRKVEILITFIKRK